MERTKKEYGTPYTLSEVRTVIQKQKMDEYHRSLMTWMYNQLHSIRAVLNNDEYHHNMTVWMHEQLQSIHAVLNDAEQSVAEPFLNKENM